MKTARLQSLSDAVIAIAATIMVLELDTPETPTFSSLWEQWPIFLAHFNSFLLIYILWFNHNAELAKTPTVSTKTFFLNGIWLAFLTLIPFATGWVGKEANASAPEIFYTIVVFLCSLLYHAIYLQVAREHPDLKEAAKKAFTRRAPIYLGYIVSLIFALTIPVLSMACVFVVTIIMAYQILRDYK